MPVDVTFDSLFGRTLRDYYQTKGIKQRVVTLPLMLDLGKMNGTNMVSNRASFFKMLSQNIEDHSYEETLQEIRDHLYFLNVLIQAGESFRVWWTNQAADYCGFVWLCDRLKAVDNRFEQIKVPTVFPLHDRLFEIDEGLSGLLPDDIGKLKLLDRLQNVSKQKRRDYSYLWRDIKEANQPVRAVINDHLTSLPATFYDFFIYEQLDKTNFIELDQLLCQLSINYGSNVPGDWYRYRIEQLICEGKLEAHPGSTSAKQLIRLVNN